MPLTWESAGACIELAIQPLLWGLLPKCEGQGHARDGAGTLILEPSLAWLSEKDLWGASNDS